MAEARRLFGERQIPTYATPEQAVRAFLYLVRYRRARDLLSQTPPSIPEAFQPDAAGVAKLVGTAPAESSGPVASPSAPIRRPR